MKDDEIRFFRTCWRLRHPDRFVRDIIYVVRDFIHQKRCWYLLEKWSNLGFYDYGVALDLGWFYPDKLPERYAALVSDMTMDGDASDGSDA